MAAAAAVGCEMVRCAVSAFVFYNQTDESIDLRVSCQIVHSRNIVSFCSCLFKCIKNSACFCYCINRKDMSCHESKISFFEYVR